MCVCVCVGGRCREQRPARTGGPVNHDGHAPWAQTMGGWPRCHCEGGGGRGTVDAVHSGSRGRLTSMGMGLGDGDGVGVGVGVGVVGEEPRVMRREVEAGCESVGGKGRTGT